MCFSVIDFDCRTQKIRYRTFYQVDQNTKQKLLILEDDAWFKSNSDSVYKI